METTIASPDKMIYTDNRCWEFEIPKKIYDDGPEKNQWVLHN